MTIHLTPLCSTALALTLLACQTDEASPHSATGARSQPASTAEGEAPTYALASVVINPDDTDKRTTYVQTLESLEAGPFDNTRAIEVPGNGVVLAHGEQLFVGAAEEPTWIRYTLRADGRLVESGRLSLQNTGASSVDFGNVIVDDDTAVSVLSSSRSALIWSPKRMEILDEIPLGIPEREGYSLENWTTSVHDGLVYIPVRWADWDGQRIYPAVSVVIVDPHARKVIDVAQDTRCASGGRVVFAQDGHGYVMGDGRNYSLQMFANAAGKPAPDNCLLRIARGTTQFDPDFHVSIKSLTGGLESISELSTARQGSGVGFAKLFYPSELPDGSQPVDFDFWEQRAHKLWTLELGDEPRAREVEAIPFSALGFEGSALDDRLYTGESLDGGQSSEVYAVDAESGRATRVFSMQGYFYGLFRLQR